MWKKGFGHVSSQNEYCGECHLIVAPAVEKVRFRGRVFHENVSQRCFTKWRLAELQKQAEKRRAE